MKSKGWIFTYIGANQDVEAVASTISITNTLCFTASEEGTSAMFAREHKARGRLFDRLANKIAPSMMADDYFDDGDDK